MSTQEDVSPTRRPGELVPVAASVPPATPPATAAAETVLVVDDNAANRDALTRRLGRRGYAVLTAADGPAALAVVASRPVDLVLLDVMMPGMSGLEVLQRIRQTHAPADLPVIMAT